LKKLPIRPVLALAAIALAAPAFAQQQAQPQEPPPPPPQPAQTGLPEGLHLRAQLGVEHDSNVLRTSANEISDTAITGGLGLSFNKRYGLQNIRAEVQYEQWWYQDQSDLDFDTLNYALAWDWRVTPRVHGVASADRREYREVTTSALTGGNVVGRRTERVELLEGVFDVTATWRGLAGVSHTKNESSQPGSWDGEPEINWGHVGVGYDLPSGSTLRFRYREGDGEYHDPAFTTFAALDTDFRDREYEVSGRWAATGKTTVDARLAHLSRDHGARPQLDFSGWVGGANVNWEITGKTRMTAGWQHDLTATGSPAGGNVESDRLFAVPVWAATGKTSFSLRYDYTRRRWNDLPAGSFDAGRRDTVQALALGVDWAVLRALTISGYLRQEKQSSSVPNADYSATVFGILAKAIF
jgi:exopolysaccharide biosynthesis operon protein EpsL